MNLQLDVYKKKEHGWYYVFEVTKSIVNQMWPLTVTQIPEDSW